MKKKQPRQRKPKVKKPKNSDKQLELYNYYKVFYHTTGHDMFMSTCNKTSKEDKKIELIIKLLQMLVKMHLDSADHNYVYWGSNKTLAKKLSDALKKCYGRYIPSNEIKIYLNRLCDNNCISMEYNPNSSPVLLKAYVDMEDGCTIAENRTINHSINNWREIRVNMERIMELHSIVDFDDPLYAELPDCSMLKRVVKERQFTCMLYHIQRLNEIKERIKKRGIKFKTDWSMFFHFVKNISKRYYKINPKVFKGKENEIIDTDTGEVVIDHEVYDEETSKTLEAIYRNIGGHYQCQY